MSKYFIRYIKIHIFFSIIICCSTDHKHNPYTSIDKPLISSPIKIVTGNPIIVNPDSYLQSHSNTEPSKFINSTSNIIGTVKIIQLSSSIKSPADFFLSLQNFNTDKGLALSSILSSCKDQFGNLWFGTDGAGISKYDGKSFTNLTLGHGLSNNSIYCIHEDKNGNIWFGTNGGGVSRYDGKSFTTFTNAQGIADNTVRSITELKNGMLLFGTDNGVSMFDGKKYSEFEPSTQLAGCHIACITEASKGNLWFGTSDKGAFVCDSLCKNFTTLDGLADNNVRFIIQDKNGIMWLGCYTGLTKYDSSFKRIQADPEFDNKNINCITKDNQENILLSSTLGLSNFKNNKYSILATSEDLSNNRIKCITEDNSGNLWSGTYGGGIFLYSYSGCSSTKNLDGNIVYNIIESSSGTIWLATDIGVTKYDGTNLITQDLEVRILCMAEDNSKNIWLGTFGKGVILYNDSKNNWTKVMALNEDTVWAITKDPSNNIWLGTNKGVIKYKSDGFFSRLTTTQGLSNNKIRCITLDSFGNFWIGTDGGGVSCYNEKSNFITNFSTQQGLANNSVYCITKDQKGNLWFGTSGSGISILTLDANKYYRSRNESDSTHSKESIEIFKNFTTEDGLANDVVYDIVENNAGDIIIGTNEGFTILNGGLDLANHKLSKGRIEHYNERTGYPIKDVNINAMYVDSKGIIWAGTGDKLVRFDYNSIPKKHSKVNVVIQNLKLNNQNISWYDLQQSKNQNLIFDSITTPPNITEEAIVFGRTLSDAKRDSMCKYFEGVTFDSISRFYPLPINLVVPCSYNNLTFDYAAIEPARPFLIHYQFMLEGYDKAWNPVTERTSASFGNLFEGEYTFRLRAQIQDGKWSDEVKYSFLVLPPWYRTWWAFTMYIILFAAVLFSFIKWRIRKLNKEKDNLEIKIQKRTSELKSEKERSESLLLNILPFEIAEELKKTGAALPKEYEEVTVLFTDFKNFTLLSEQHNAHQLVELINYYYSAFDNIITKYGIEKIKTIGDSYMCAGGIPVENKTNPYDTVMAALEIRDFVLNEKEKRKKEGKDYFEIRIGLHTGPVVAGIVGEKKFVYDIWGDTVNIASRMESSGEAGKVNISESTYQLVKAQFNCIHRGKIQAKNKGEIDMYFVDVK